MIKRWQAGDRVTRLVFLDDGTWRHEGDSCLPRSPVRHGTVVCRAADRPNEVWVRFDSGSLDCYFDHGLEAEVVKGVEVNNAVKAKQGQKLVITDEDSGKRYVLLMTCDGLFVETDTVKTKSINGCQGIIIPSVVS